MSVKRHTGAQQNDLSKFVGVAVLPPCESLVVLEILFALVFNVLRFVNLMASVSISQSINLKRRPNLAGRRIRTNLEVSKILSMSKVNNA